MRIVVYRSGALGDTLLTFPTLAALRRRWPQAHISLICRGDVHALALASGLADRAYSHDLAAWARLFGDGATPPDLAREIFGEADIALLWASDADGEVASRLRTLGARKIVVESPPPQPGSQRHVALQLLSALNTLGIAAPRDAAALSTLLPPLKWPNRAQEEAGAAWERIQDDLAGRPALAIHPGSGGARKRWPHTHFARLIHQLRGDYAPLLIAGPQDEEVVAQVIAEAGVTPVVRGLSVAGLAALLSQCTGYVGNDSGVTHLAGMLDLPTVALFGPTDPAQWTPLGARVVALRSPTWRLEHLPVAHVAAAIRRVDPTP